MSVTATFLHAYPHTKIATMVRERLVGCRDAQIVSGFATPDGIDALRAKASAGKISRLVLGAATFKAFEALDDLIEAGLSAMAARVHLGHSRRTGGRKHPFERLRPMLHSKVYLFDMPDGSSAAFVGSHNLTGFALRGMNGEAGVLLEGDASDPVFADVRAHVEESFSQAVKYDATLKEAYARWYAEYLDRVRVETSDMPRDYESRKTIILLAELGRGDSPKVGERFYFELDKRIEEVKAIDTEVHLHLFLTAPATPRDALRMVTSASKSVVATVEALDSGAGSVEVNADWFIDDSGGPTLRPTVRPFRPTLSSGKQQVRALIKSELNDTYEYLFEVDADNWEPILGDKVMVDEETKERWNPVIGFGQPGMNIEVEVESPIGRVGVMRFEALPEMSPDSGSFILVSRRRKKRE